MMEVTPNHPIYVEGKGWLWAKYLATELGLKCRLGHVLLRGMPPVELQLQEKRVVR